MFVRTHILCTVEPVAALRDKRNNAAAFLTVSIALHPAVVWPNSNAVLIRFLCDSAPYSLKAPEQIRRKCCDIFRLVIVLQDARCPSLLPNDRGTFPRRCGRSSFYILIKKARNANDSSPDTVSKGQERVQERRKKIKMEWKISFF